MFYHFRQNNSGGSFDVDDRIGIGVDVWVEAHSAGHANDRARGIGLYFDGVSRGRDCDCCGDRWYEAWSEERGEQAPIVDPNYNFMWHDTVYVHNLDGSIGRIRDVSKPQEFVKEEEDL